MVEWSTLGTELSFLGLKRGSGRCSRGLLFMAKAVLVVAIALELLVHLSAEVASNVVVLQDFGIHTWACTR